MKKFEAKKEFVVGKHNIGWLDADFKRHFPDTSFGARSLGSFQKLQRDMTDAEIESDLKPGICELGDVVAFMDSAPQECKDGYANIFYTPECVVSVGWSADDRGWHVRAWGRGGSGWRAGRRVFSPATGRSSTQPSDSSDPQTLVPPEKMHITVTHDGVSYSGILTKD